MSDDMNIRKMDKGRVAEFLDNGGNSAQDFLTKLVVAILMRAETSDELDVALVYMRAIIDDERVSDFHRAFAEAVFDMRRDELAQRGGRLH